MNIFLTHYTLSPPPTPPHQIQYRNRTCAEVKSDDLFWTGCGDLRWFWRASPSGLPFPLAGGALHTVLQVQDLQVLWWWWQWCHLHLTSSAGIAAGLVAGDCAKRYLFDGGRPMGAAADSDVVQSPREGTLKIRHPCSVCVWDEKVSVKWTSSRVA